MGGELRNEVITCKLVSQHRSFCFNTNFHYSTFNKKRRGILNKIKSEQCSWKISHYCKSIYNCYYHWPSSARNTFQIGIFLEHWLHTTVPFPSAAVQYFKFIVSQNLNNYEQWSAYETYHGNINGCLKQQQHQHNKPTSSFIFINVGTPLALFHTTLWQGMANTITLACCNKNSFLKQNTSELFLEYYAIKQLHTPHSYAY